jgi:hypothetical protein
MDQTTDSSLSYYHLLNNNLLRLICSKRLKRDLQADEEPLSTLKLLDQKETKKLERLRSMLYYRLPSLTLDDMIVAGALKGINYNYPLFSGDSSLELIRSYTVWSLAASEGRTDSATVPKTEDERRAMSLILTGFMGKDPKLVLLSSNNDLLLLYKGRDSEVKENPLTARIRKYSRSPFGPLLDIIYGCEFETAVHRGLNSAIEEVVLNSKDLGELTDNLKISIPPNIGGNGYLVDNIIHYKDCLLSRTTEDRGTFLRSLRNRADKILDGDLFAGCLAIIPHTSRPSLVEGIVNLLDKESWFISLTPTTGYNKCTTILDNVEEEWSVIPFVCFGTLFHHRYYSLDELNSAFSLYKDGKIFIKPENPRRSFTIEEVQRLQDVLEWIEDVKVKIELTETIKNSLQLLKFHSSYSLEKGRELEEKFSSKMTEVTDVLKMIFVLGMRMRGWGGGDDPYPLTASSTKMDWDKEIEMQVHLQKVLSVLSEPSNSVGSWIGDFKIVDYCEGRFQISLSHSIAQLLDKIRKSNFCYRVASSYLVFTACYHSTSFNGGVTLEIDLDKLEPIN